MMRITSIVVGLSLVVVGGCSSAPAIREAAVVPALAGPLRIGAPAVAADSTPPDSTERDIIICVIGAGPCPTEFRRLYYSRGLPDPIDLVRVDVWDSTVATMALRFKDSTSVATAAAWVERWLRRRPWTRTETVVEWKDGRYGVHLEARSGWRPTALVYRLTDMGIRFPSLSAGEWWELCTELSVNFCTR